MPWGSEKGLIRTRLLKWIWDYHLLTFGLPSCLLLAGIQHGLLPLQLSDGEAWEGGTQMRYLLPCQDFAALLLSPPPLPTVLLSYASWPWSNSLCIILLLQCTGLIMLQGLCPAQPAGFGSRQSQGVPPGALLRALHTFSPCPTPSFTRGFSQAKSQSGHC